MADAFGSTPRERGRVFVSHHYPDLDFPQAVWKALNLLCVCVLFVRSRREEQDGGAGGREVPSVCPSVTL